MTGAEQRTPGAVRVPRSADGWVGKGWMEFPDELGIQGTEPFPFQCSRSVTLQGWGFGEIQLADAWGL